MILPEGLITSVGDFLQGIFRRSVDLTPAGALIRIAEGANASLGITAAMVAGTILTANTLITANTRIFLMHTGGGVVANYGHLYVSARVAGVSFTVTSSNVADTDAVRFLLIEPL